MTKRERTACEKLNLALAKADSWAMLVEDQKAKSGLMQALEEAHDALLTIQFHVNQIWR